MKKNVKVRNRIGYLILAFVFFSNTVLVGTSLLDWIKTIRMEYIVKDLRNHKKESIYYPQSTEAKDVGIGIRVYLNNNKLYASFYMYPMGPWRIVEVETNSWGYEE